MQPRATSKRRMCPLACLPPGTSILPEDFPERLDRFKEACGLSWTLLGEKLGVDPRQVLRWRKGVEPSGGAMMALMGLAELLPNGMELLMRPSGRKLS